MARDTRLLSRADVLFAAFAVAVLIAGLVVFLVNRGGGASAEKRTPLSQDAKLVALRFVRDAVQRRAPANAYDSVTPALRRGTTRAEWSAGEIPVVPYPAPDARLALFRAQYSYTDRALLDVELRSRKLGPQAFELGLVRRGGRWLVSLWQPASRIAPHPA